MSDSEQAEVEITLSAVVARRESLEEALSILHSWDRDTEPARLALDRLIELCRQSASGPQEAPKAEG